ncbi:MAG: ThuA domain-containing protein, partial [Prolixibacteraceae bacterium]|nr:ThuA domain-containing protein [Prolixibacteraceae bacterium]
IILLVALLALNSACSSQKKAPEFTKPLKVLVFSKTMGFRHASISEGLKMLYDQSKAENWVITATEDASLFSDDFLTNFDLAVFLSPTGDVLNNDEQAAFERFINSGKGFVGIHAAADCEYDWPFYGNLVGAYFVAHPPAQKATIIFENYDNPAMEPFKGMKTYTTTDEWYAYKKNPRKKVHVLARLDETSIKKSNNDKWKMGDHPIIWWNEKEGARSFYTVFGHTNEAFQDKKVIEHITNAINWAGHRID